MGAIKQKSVLDHLNSHHHDRPFWMESAFHNGSDQGFFADFEAFNIGAGHAPQVLAVNGTADANLHLGLQTAIPADNVSISISLGSVIDLAGFGTSAASGTVASGATSQATITLSHGVLNATYTALISIDVTASIPAAHATVHMHITDSFQLSVSGKGFVGTTLDQQNASSGTVIAPIPAADPANGQAGKPGATFDLARFAASILNTGQWDIQFAAFAPGESLRAVGTSELTVSATADLPGCAGPERLSLYDTERSSFVFNEKSGSAGGGLFGMQPCGSGQFGPFHTV